MPLQPAIWAHEQYVAAVLLLAGLATGHTFAKIGSHAARAAPLRWATGVAIALGLLAALCGDVSERERARSGESARSSRENGRA